MTSNYSSYSKQRKAILQQVKRLEKRGYITKEQYHLPTVKELKAMPKAQAARVVKSARGYTTSAVRRTAYKPEEYVVKRTGEIKTRKVSYAKASKEERSISAKKSAATRRARGHEFDTEAIEEGVAYYEAYGEYPKWFKRRYIDTGIYTAPKEKEFDFGQWQKDFINAANDDVKDEARAYTEAVREGYDKTFQEYLGGAGIEPDALTTFTKKLSVLEESDSATADALKDLFNQYQGYNAQALEKRFKDAEGNLPEFDYHYDNGHLDTTEVLNMARLITGKPLTGTQAKKLREAIDKDTGA